MSFPPSVSSYDLRYSTSSGPFDFASAEAVTEEMLSPGFNLEVLPGGRTKFVGLKVKPILSANDQCHEKLILQGIEFSDTTVSFGVWCLDDEDLHGDASEATTPLDVVDLFPPNKVEDFTAAFNTSVLAIVIEFTAPGDDEDKGTR